MIVMPQKPRLSLYQQFTTGLINEEDFQDLIASKFNLIDDKVERFMIISNAIGTAEISASTLSVLNTSDGFPAWTVDTFGNLIPTSGHFQDIGSPLEPVDELFTDEITAFNVANLPDDTTIGDVSPSEINALDGVTSNIQDQINNIHTFLTGSLNFSHTQLTPSLTWYIPHNRDSENVVYTLLDASKEEVIPDIFKVIDSNTVEVSFAELSTGTINMVFF